MAADPTKIEEAAAGLRELADWIETHPDVLHNSDLAGISRLLLCRLEKEDFVELARAIAPATLDENDRKYFSLRRRFGPIELHAYIDHSKVGTATPRMVKTDAWELDADVKAVVFSSSDEAVA